MWRGFATLLVLCVHSVHGSDLEFHAAHKLRAELTRNIDRIVEDFNNKFPGPNVTTIFRELANHFVAPRQSVDRFGVAQPFPTPCAVISVAYRPTLEYELELKRATAVENCTVIVFDCEPYANVTHVDGLVKRQDCISNTYSISDFMKWHRPYEDAVWHVRQQNRSEPFLARLDAGGWEYAAMRTIASSTYEPRPQYVSMLAKLTAADPSVPWFGQTKSFADLAIFVDNAWRVGGFYLTSVKVSEACKGGCAELTFALGPRAREAQQRWVAPFLGR